MWLGSLTREKSGIIPSESVKRSAIIAIVALLLCSPASRSRGAGVTYPDGSVSTFAPGFFGVGICPGSVSTEVNGVAANGGTFIAAVGNCGNPEGSSNQTAATLFKPDHSIIVLPQTTSTATTTATGISADGKIISGVSGMACYWDANNQLHSLPGNGLDGAQAALAVSRDGSTIGGDLPASPDSSAHAVSDASLWATGGTGYSNLGRPNSYDLAEVRGLSQDGQLSCGVATRFADAQKGITGISSAFVQTPGGGIQLLSDPSDTFLAVAAGVGFHSDSAGGLTEVVGASGNTPMLWQIVHGSEYLAYSLPKLANSAGTATAIDAAAKSAVGFSQDLNTLENTALIWDITTVTQVRLATIGAKLRNTYKVNTGAWRLGTAGCISADGSTIGGQGTNPDGKLEGWIAVLPPILHPPILVNPGPQHTNPGERFYLEIETKNLDLLSGPETFTVKGLPNGFDISTPVGFIDGVWRTDQAPAGTYTVTVTSTNQDGSGSTTFTLTLPPQNVVDELLQGHSYLPQNKPPGEASFYASVGKGVSANGQTAVGTDGFGSDARAYQWTNADGISGLPMLDGALRTFSSALAASADGKTIVGQAASAPGDDGNDHSVAVVWTTSTTAAANARQAPTHYAEGPSTAALITTNIGLFPQGGVSVANAVSGDGSIVVGYGDEKMNGISYQVYQAFQWTQTGGMVGLGWLPGGRLFSQAYGTSADGSTIVGVSDSSAGTQAMRYTTAQGMTGLGLPAGASYGRAVATSSNGGVIVGYNTINGNDHAFRWTAAGGMTDLGVLQGDAFSEATAVSADGSIVAGQSATDFSHQRAFIWDATTGMRDLQTVLVAANPQLANWTLQTANSISADGKIIVGAGKNPNGDEEGFTAVLQVQPAQPLNISTRMRVQTGDNVLIGGFIITGTDTKKLIIRGIGPSLAAYGIQNAMADPTLELHQGNSTIATNDNWRENESAVIATGLPPSNDLESAIVTTLAPGAYTAVMVDKNNQPGVGLVEIYDLAGKSKLGNISTRGFVDTGDNVMIGGFIIGGGGVGGNERVIVRAIGPSLSNYGVPNALPNTTLDLYDSNGLVVASNDNWKDTQEAEIRATTIPPTNDLESAIVDTLAPGAYTAIVRGKNGSTGVSLVEVYNLQ